MLVSPKAAKLIIVCIIALLVFMFSIWACRRYADYKGFSSPSSESGSADTPVGPAQG